MSTALFAIPGVLAPLQGLWRWLMPAQDQPKHSGVERLSHEAATHSIARNVRRPGAGPHNFSHATTRKPLRIVRVLEVGQSPSSVGRMVISGRMADVCAELDRLAALH